jgi:ribosomal protein S5
LLSLTASLSKIVIVGNKPDDGSMGLGLTSAHAERSRAGIAAAQKRMNFIEFPIR